MHRNSTFRVCGPTCCDPCWRCRRWRCTPAAPHHVAGVAAGKVSKTTMHFCYGTFVSFQRAGGWPITFLVHFSCLATLHDSLFWEAQVGTWDTELTKHSVSLQWGQLVPWQCPQPCDPARWTTPHWISWQSAVGKEASAVRTISFSGGNKASRIL